MAEGDQFFLASSATGERIELTGDTSVGRSDDCDLVVSQGQPSRQHAKITLESGGVFVEDLNSTNGTFINGARLAEKKQLNDGDEVAFDENKFNLQVVSARPAGGDATVLRQVEDPARTILRPVIKEPAAAAAPAAAAPEPAAPEPVAPEPAASAPVAQTTAPEPAPAVPEPALPAAAEAKPKPVKPGSWADPNEKNASSTQFFSREDLEKMRGATIEEKVESDVPYLQVASGSAAGSLVQLIPEGAKKEWTIGSDGGRDIVFNDKGVSEFNSILVHESGRWKVVDQMSTNGTYINGGKTRSGFLNSGDKVRVGTVECVFVLPGAPAKGGAAEGSGGSKIWASVGAFVAVLVLLFGAYFLL